MVLLLEPRAGASSPEAFARSLNGLRELRFLVEWSHRRHKLFRPSTRETKRRSIEITVDAADYRNEMLTRWRANTEWRHLADLASG